MDEAGIDIQVLSHTAPSLQKVSSGAVELARRVNDRLAAIVATQPTRYAAFAALPTADPAAAADELARCVETLGFKGAMIHGLAHGQFIDDARYWPIFARAEALDVPIYLHPSMPHQAVIDAYYKEYAKDFPVLLRAAWGFTVETATLAIRLVLSGVFDKHPKLKFILGHLGEGLPFLLWRINNGLARPGQKPVAVPRHFQRAFLRHDQRLLLRSGAAAVRAGARRRPHPVLGRLSVRGERAGAGLARARAAVRRGQGQDRERQRKTAVADVTALTRR